MQPRAAAMRGGFVGRKEVMDLLRSGLDDSVSGRGRLILLSGEPGIGKTRTAEEFAALSQERGARVLWGRCYEGEGAPAFWPWVEILREGIPLLGPDELNDVIETADEIVQLVPSLRRGAHDVAQAATSESPEARFRLFDAVTTFLGRLARAAPLVIVIDDLQGADRSSLLLLEFVSRRLRQMNVLLLATYRDRESRSEHGLNNSLVQLARDPSTQRIELPGLSRAEIAEFVEASTGSPAPDALVTQLLERTEGNPLFVSEFVRAIDARAGAHGTDGCAVTVPRGVRAMIEQRLTPLSRECKTALSAAAVMGREFAWQPLASVLSAVATEGAIGANLDLLLEEAAANGIVGRSPFVAGCWRFAHALIRETLYDGLRNSERARLHQSVGDAIEQLPDADERLAELAHHFAEAASARVSEGSSNAIHDKAIDYARRAGDRAINLHAYEEAIRLYEAALALLDRADPGNDMLRCALLVDLGIAKRDAGDLEAGKECLRRAVVLARRFDLREELARAALSFGTRIFWGEQVAADQERVELLESAVEAWGGTRSPWNVRLLARLAAALRISQQRERRRVLCERALSMARRVGDSAALGEALNTWLIIGWEPANLEARVTTARELAELGRRSQHLESEFEGHRWQMTNHLEIGDARGVEIEGLLCERLSRAIRHPYYDVVVRTAATMRMVMQGKFTEARKAAQEVLSIEQQLSSGIPFAYAQFMFALACTQGRAKALSATAESVRPFASPHNVLADIRSALACVLCELDRVDEARAQFEALAAEEFAEFPPDETWFLAMRHVTEACAYLEDDRRAEILVELLRPFETRAVVSIASSGYFGPVAHCLAILEARLSRWDDAVRHFEQAQEMNRTLGARPWLARTQFEYARMLVSRGQNGDRERSQTLLQQAAETARELEMPLLQERLSRLLLLPSHSLDRSAPSLASPDERETNLLRCEGQYWTISYERKVIRLKDGKGVQYLARLLRHPGREVLALDLVQNADVTAQGAAEHPNRATRGLGLDLIDAQAKSEYRRRVHELRAELDEAEQFNDLGRAEKLKEELDFIARQLNAAVGLGGRDRKAGAAGERARLMVTKRIKSILKVLDTLHPPLAHHLRACVKTGYYCAYTPPPGEPVVWQT